MRSCAGRGGETEEAAAVAGATTLAPVTVDGSLELTWGAQAFPLALIWVQILHVPKEENTGVNASDQHRSADLLSRAFFL